MTAPESSTTTGNPKLNAEEIGQRFLKLIGGLESRSDLTPGLVQNVLGLKLQRHEDRGLYHHGWRMDNGWSLGIVLYDESPGHKQRVSFGIDQFSESMPSSSCALDFERYHNALKAMGFHASPVYGEIGQLEYWRYFKPDDLVFQIIPQHAVPTVPGIPGPLCVRSIDMLD
jgi:hypothetical protein